MRIKPYNLRNDNLFTQLNSFFKTRKKLEQAQSVGEDVIVDFTNVEWFTPAYLAPFSVVYNDILDANIDISVTKPSGFGKQTYLNQICFPEGTHDPTDEYQNHIPLCLMDTNHDDEIVETVGRKVRDLIRENYSDFSASNIDGVTYPINEIIDNVDCHSQCQYGTLLIQNYPNKPYLDICVADNGISIPGSYDNFGTNYSTNKEAVKMALNGISTRPDAGHLRGYGIPTTTEMVCNGLNGEVIIATRNAIVHQKQENEPVSRSGDWSWDGTIFIARLYEPSNNFNYHDYIT